MTPDQHIAWLFENTAWIESLTVSQLEVAVPCCPGWTVENVVNHLSFGVGLAYPLGVASSPAASADKVFSAIKRPAENPSGEAALEAFATNMRRCIKMFSAADPQAPCWTYAGPGTASFWFRRAAIETALHKVDIEDALADSQSLLSSERTAEAIRETVDFTLPLAAKIAGQPAGSLVVFSPELNVKVKLGEESERVMVSGAGQDVLLALWGRNRDRVAVTGNQEIAADWLSLIERAFAGRADFS